MMNKLFPRPRCGGHSYGDDKLSMDYGQVRMIDLRIRIDEANIRRFSFIANKQLFFPPPVFIAGTPKKRTFISMN